MVNLSTSGRTKSSGTEGAIYWPEGMARNSSEINPFSYIGLE